MISYLKKHFIIICGLLIISGGIALAQSSGLPITLAPNADPNAPGYATPLNIVYDGIVRSDALSVGTLAAPITNSFLNVAGDLKVKRDNGSTAQSYNCQGKTNTNGSNKCYPHYSSLNANISTPRNGYPEFISTGLSNILGGLVVLGKDDSSNIIMDPNVPFPTITNGSKLDISGTNVFLQGDPASGFLNHAAGTLFPGGNCSDPNHPEYCKKYACIESGQGNIKTCQTQTELNTMNPARPQCGDGIDNDGDGLVDGDDMGCFCPNSMGYQQLWTSESAAPASSQSPCYTGLPL